MPSQKYMLWCIAFNEKLHDVEFYYHLHESSKDKKSKTAILQNAYDSSQQAYRQRWNDAREALEVFLRRNPMPAEEE